MSVFDRKDLNMRTIKLNFIKHIIFLFLATSLGVVLLTEVQRSIDRKLQIKRLGQIAKSIQLSFELELQRLEKIRPLLFGSTNFQTYRSNPQTLIKKLNNRP